MNRISERKGSYLLTRILGPLTTGRCRVLILIAVISSFHEHRPSSFLPQVDILMRTNIVEDLGETGPLKMTHLMLKSSGPRCLKEAVLPEGDACTLCDETQPAQNCVGSKWRWEFPPQRHLRCRNVTELLQQGVPGPLVALV